MSKRTIIRLGVVAATTVATAATAAVGVATAGSVAVPHTQPAWTTHTKALGAASSGAATSGRLYLAPRGGLANLAQVATAMAKPGSATYHRFLTNAQYVARYA